MPSGSGLKNGRGARPGLKKVMKNVPAKNKPKLSKAAAIKARAKAAGAKVKAKAAPAKVKAAAAKKKGANAKVMKKAAPPVMKAKFKSMIVARGGLRAAVARK